MEGIIGMIKLFVVDTPPANWMLCDGRSLAKAEYPELFALIGNRFGGEGEYFALPKLEKDPAGYFVMRVTSTSQETASFKGMVSQMTLFAGPVVPVGWLPCDGAMTSPEEYPLLAKLMGGRFGVDEKGNFALPNIPPNNGVVYIICAEGLDPMPPEDDDDDY
jgi:microcystin-dependent protein